MSWIRLLLVSTIPVGDRVDTSGRPGRTHAGGRTHRYSMHRSLWNTYKKLVIMTATVLQIMKNKASLSKKILYIVLPLLCYKPIELQIEAKILCKDKINLMLLPNCIHMSSL